MGKFNTRNANGSRADYEAGATPQVSIILPVYNDEEWIERALRSCRDQTLTNIEIIVVDDASTDGTVDIVKRISALDDRIKIVRQPSNQSAFQGRRVGVEKARAPFILFVDGDDELLPEAAEQARTSLLTQGADVLGFGCVVVSPDGRTGSQYERDMQPRHAELHGTDIIASIFPAGATAQGQLWRYMFKRELLIEAYGLVPAGLVLPRVNDLPLAFLALTLAKRYSSISTVLYRYHFGLGASGHGLQSIDDYDFTASAIDSVEAIRTAVEALASTSIHGDVLTSAYRTIVLSVIGRVLHYIQGMVDDALRAECLERLGTSVGWHNLVAACADYCPDARDLLAPMEAFTPAPTNGARHVLLRTGNLRTGGVQGVLVAQAHYLVEAGYVVTIALDSGTATNFVLPPGVEVIQIKGDSKAGKLDHFSRILTEYSIDAIIDHHVFYNDGWPYYALLAASLGVPMLGWIHNFALRPVLDGSSRLETLDRYLPSLSVVVVLSEVDVTYWNSRGVEHVVYIPNPPSPLLLGSGVAEERKSAPQKSIEIAWWGRLQQSTKQARELIKIGRELKLMDIDFRLTIIGPDSPDLSASQLHEMASDLGIGDNLSTPGALHGPALAAAIRHADIFVSTSIIEGYPLVLVEAQALGLPIVMYDLPWLSYVQGNGGVAVVPQGDRYAAAREIATLSSDEQEYAGRSGLALEAARGAMSLNLGAQYQRLLDGEIQSEISAERRASHLEILLDQSLRFTRLHAEREERALKRARRALTATRRTRTQGPAAREGRDGVAVTASVPSDSGRRSASGRKRMPPAVRASGLKGWLQSFLPATMRQAGYFARHADSAGWAQHDELLAEIEYVVEQVERLDETLGTLRHETKRQVGSVMKVVDEIKGQGANEPSADGAKGLVETGGEVQAASLREGRDGVAVTTSVPSDSGRRSASGRKRMPPAVRASGLKGWLQSFLPATMRQAGYFARHADSAGWAQHDELLAEIEYVVEQVERLDETLGTLRHETKRQVGSVMKVVDEIKGQGANEPSADGTKGLVETGGEMQSPGHQG